MEMTNADGQTLLAEFARSGSEAAFAELLKRYVDLVYSVALRLLNGDSHRAQDVTQLVFIDLARDARKLSPKVFLGGWLHRHTCFLAANVRRAESRRESRERIASEMISNHDNDAFSQTTPVLDEALNELSSDDRHAVVLRFFERRDFRSVGASLGASEEAARKRVNRALEKLQASLRLKGVSISTAALGAGLTAGAIGSAPEGLAASILPLALSGTTVAATSTTIGLIKFMTGTKIGMSAGGVLALLGLAYSVSEHRLNTRLTLENKGLNEQVAAISEENSTISNKLADAARTAALSREQFQELMRLRSEAGQLKRQLAELARATNSNKAQRAVARDSSDNEATTMGIRGMRDAKIWIYAFREYASRHNDEFPTDFDQVHAHLSSALRSDLNEGEVLREQAAFLESTNQFEITYRGKWSPITNSNSAIVMREKEAWPNPAGGWNRIYGFADGHTEVHRADDGNFEPWEQKHAPQLAPDAP